MIQSAEDLSAAMAPLVDNPTIYISLRGRGRSSSPETGYTFYDQVSDIGAVVDHLELDQIGIFGNSLGGAFAIGYTLQERDRVRYLIVHDYPPVYPALTDQWRSQILGLDSNRISDHASQRLVAESEKVVLLSELNTIPCPVLITRGGEPDALLSEQLAELYRQNIPDCRIAVLLDTGHDPFHPTPSPFQAILQKFIQETQSH